MLVFVSWFFLFCSITYSSAPNKEVWFLLFYNISLYESSTIYPFYYWWIFVFFSILSIMNNRHNIIMNNSLLAFCICHLVKLYIHLCWGNTYEFLDNRVCVLLLSAVSPNSQFTLFLSVHKNFCSFTIFPLLGIVSYI